MGIDPAIVLPPADMRFTEVELGGDVTNIVRGIVALLACSTDPIEALVGPDMFVLVEIGTESVKVVSAMRFLNSFDTAILIIWPCLPPLVPIFVMFWAWASWPRPRLIPESPALLATLLIPQELL